MAQLSYRQAVARALAQEMRRDASVRLIGEDVGAAGGVFKLTEGLFEEFGPLRVRDTPISEQAIIGLALGAAMTGMRPVCEIMFSDFVAVCWDGIANQVAKLRYMTNGDFEAPLVIRAANGGGVRFGAQHSQSIENWAMAVPGLKVVAPATPRDACALLAAAIRDPDPVLFLEHKGLLAQVEEMEDGELVGELGKAAIRRAGSDLSVVAVAAMVPVALEAAAQLAAAHGIECEVIDLRTLMPLDMRTVLESVARTTRLVTVEENPRVCGWGAEIAATVADEAFFDLDAPIRRITTPHVPLPFAAELEDAMIPTPARVVSEVLRLLS